MGRPFAACILLAFAACAGLDGSAPDFGASDLASSDVPMLQDAVVLEPGGPADLASDAGRDDGSSPDAAASDTNAPADTVAPSDPGPGPGPDEGFVDAPSDASLPFDDVAPADLPPSDDVPPDAFGGDPGVEPPPCGAGAKPCAPGSTCVTDSDGHTYCAPLDECSGKGAIDIEDLVSLLISGQGEVQVKVLAMAWPGQPACTPMPCSKEHPCCNTCFAPLFIGAEAFPIVLNGQGLAIGCQGPECDVLDACRPFTSGSWYWVWGTAGILGGKPQLTVDGFCPADGVDLP